MVKVVPDHLLNFHPHIFNHPVLVKIANIFKTNAIFKTICENLSHRFVQKPPYCDFFRTIFLKEFIFEMLKCERLKLGQCP